MRIISLENARESVPTERVFRNSSISSIILFFVFFGLFLAVVGHYIWYPGVIIVLGYLVYLWLGFWFGLIAWLAWYRIKAGSLPSNWLLKASPERLLIKFRSFQNHYYPETDPVVIEINWRDIDWVRKTKENSSRLVSQEIESQFFTYLDMKLNLSDEELNKIKLGLTYEIQRKPLRSTVGELKHELFKARKLKAPKYEIDHIKQRLQYEKSVKHKGKTSGVKHNDFPVSLVNDSILRIRWNGIKPKIDKTLIFFSDWTRIESDDKFKTDSTVQLDGKELDDMILDRIIKGDKFDAIVLAKRHYGYTTTEAKKFIDELTDDLS